MMVPPYHLMVCVWGPRFWAYMLDNLVPSLLSPFNVPALAGGRYPHRLAVATTEADWERYRGHLRMLVGDALDIRFTPIDPCPLGRSGCEHMGRGHLPMVRDAFEARAHGCILTPDMVLSDGALSWAQEQAIVRGVEAVLVPALRFDEARLFSALSERMRPERLMAGSLDARTLTRAAVASLHSSCRAYDWDSSHFSSFPCAVLFHAPNGLLVHSLSWAPLLIDYGRFPRHDTSCVEGWTIDGDYLCDNLGPEARVEIAQGDDAMWVSWSPSDDRPWDMTPNRWHTAPGVGRLVKGTILRDAVVSGTFDALKQRLVFTPVRWKVCTPFPGDDATWRPVEARARRVLRFYLYGVGAAPWLSSAVVVEPVRWMWKVCRQARQLVGLAAHQASHLGSVLRHPTDGARWRHRGRELWRQVREDVR